MPDPALTDYAKLPLWGQIGGFFAVIVAITAAIRQGLQPKPPAPVPAAVVVAADLADPKPLEKLAKAVDRLCDQLEEHDRDLKSGLKDVAHETERVHDKLTEIGEAISGGVTVRFGAGHPPQA